jgi:hypothetical protein
MKEILKSRVTYLVLTACGLSIMWKMVSFEYMTMIGLSIIIVDLGYLNKLLK